MESTDIVERGTVTALSVGTVGSTLAANHDGTSFRRPTDSRHANHQRNG